MSKPNRPGQKIILKSVEELLGVFNEEAAMDIEIDKIRPFRNHPFTVMAAGQPDSITLLKAPASEKRELF